jgi:hypothetical protein
MSTPTTSTLSSTQTLNQSGQPRPTDVIPLGRKAEPDNSSLNNDHITPVSAQVNVGQIKPVDRRTIEGSTPDDHRAPSRDTVVLPANPAPRDPRGQSQVMSSRLSDPAKPQAVTGLSEASQN